MKRFFIILAVALTTLSILDAQAQTKEFKDYMQQCRTESMHAKRSDNKFEITEFSGDILKQLMPKAVADKKGIVNRINSIFQVVMDEYESSVFYEGLYNWVKKHNKYNHKMTMTLNGTEYKIFEAKLESGVHEYLFLISNGKDYCVCNIVGVLSTSEIMSFIGVKNDNATIKGDKTDTVEVIIL